MLQPGNERYRGCQKNDPIEGRFSATNPYAAILFSEHYYGKRYKRKNTKTRGFVLLGLGHVPEF